MQVVVEGRKVSRRYWRLREAQRDRERITLVCLRGRREKLRY